MKPHTGYTGTAVHLMDRVTNKRHILITGLANVNKHKYCSVFGAAVFIYTVYHTAHAGIAFSAHGWLIY